MRVYAGTRHFGVVSGPQRSNWRGVGRYLLIALIAYLASGISEAAVFPACIATVVVMILVEYRKRHRLRR